MQTTATTTSGSGSDKSTAGAAGGTRPEFELAPETSVPAGNPLRAADPNADAPAPPPVWTRYIDSRLKQFCTR